MGKAEWDDSGMRGGDEVEGEEGASVQFIIHGIAVLQCYMVQVIILNSITYEIVYRGGRWCKCLINCSSVAQGAASHVPVCVLYNVYI